MDFSAVILSLAVQNSVAELLGGGPHTTSPNRRHRRGEITAEMSTEMDFSAVILSLAVQNVVAGLLGGGSLNQRSKQETPQGWDNRKDEF